MNFDRTSERKNKLEELAKLKRLALEELERHGYEVRGKTPTKSTKVKTASKESARELTDLNRLLEFCGGRYDFNSDARFEGTNAHGRARRQMIFGEPFLPNLVHGRL